MADISLVQILTGGGIPALFALLLVWTLKTSSAREERLMKREDTLLEKLDELAKTMARISSQLESLTREIDRIREKP